MDLLFSANIGRQNNTVKRDLLFNALTAQGKYHSSLLQINARAVYDLHYHSQQAWHIKPYAAHYKQDGYQERLDSIFAQHADSMSMNYTTGELGVDFDTLPNEELQKICQGLGIDYAIIVDIDNNEGRYSSAVFSESFKVNIETTVKIFNVKTAKYLDVQRASAIGSSNAAVFGVPSVARAYVDGVRQSMAQIKVNTALIQ